MAGSRAGRVTAALMQAITALGAHAIAAGCLPNVRGLAVAVPACLVAALLLGRVLRGRTLLVLITSQVGAHTILGAVAACGAHAAGTHDSGGSHLLMLCAHLAGLVLGWAVLGHVLRVLERAVAVIAARVRRCVRSLQPVRPFVVNSTVPAPAPARWGSRVAAGSAPVRGPPHQVSPLAA